MLPEGDPDEIVRAGRVTELEALIENAKPVKEAAIEIISQRKETETIEHLTEEVIRLGAGDTRRYRSESLRSRSRCRP